MLLSSQEDGWSVHYELFTINAATVQNVTCSAISVDWFGFPFLRMRFCMKRRRNVVACVYVVWEGDLLQAPLRTDSPWMTWRRSWDRYDHWMNKTSHLIWMHELYDEQQRLHRLTLWTWPVSVKRSSAVVLHPSKRPMWWVWSRSTRKPWHCPSGMEPTTSTW